MVDSASYICSPQDNTTLLLSHYWLPINITTAKEAIRKLVCNGSRNKKNPTVKVLSGSGEPMLWEDWIDSGSAIYNSNQPFLASANRLYPVPTIILTSANWCYRTFDKPNIKYLYSRFKGRCQICGEKFSIKRMSIEHILPKSKHGAHDSFNITMTCKLCNNRKSSMHPYKNYKGKKLEAPHLLPFFHTFINERPEWRPFLFKMK